MVRNYKKTRPPPEYTAQDVINAVTDVRNGNLTYQQASGFYGVPRSVISDRVVGKVKVEDSIGAGRKTALQPQVEQDIVNCLIARSRLGAPCGREELLEAIAEYVRNNNLVTPFRDGKPGEDWYLSFMARYPELSLKKAEQLQKARFVARAPDVIYDFYGIVEQEYNAHDLHKHPEFVLDCDEAAFPSDPSRSRAIGEKGVPLSRVSGGSGKENTSVLATVSASGHALPPLVIFKGAAVQARWVSKNAYPGTTFAATGNGWMEEPVFFNWLADSLVPYITELRKRLNLPKQRALLFYDGHKSHYSMRIIKLAIDNNISLLKLPSHLTDKLQPLDTAVFGPLKLVWDKKLIAYAKRQLGYGSGRLTKEMFGELLGETWREGMKKETIVKGFESTGLFPVDKSKFDKGLFDPRELRNYEHRKNVELKRAALGKAPHAFEPPTKKFLVISEGNSTESSEVIDGTGSKTNAQDQVEEDIQAVALDLSTKIHQGTPEKPVSIVDIFAARVRSMPQRDELSALKPKTPEQIARLKCQKYGEVLTTEAVLQRLAEAEAEKEKKKSKTKKKTESIKQVPKKKSSKKKDQEKPELAKNTSDTEAEDEPMVLQDESADDLQVSDDEAVELLTEDFVDSSAGSKALVDQFVLVRFKKPGLKEHFMYYIGKVVAILDDDLQISFLRKKNVSFRFPDNPDVSVVSKLDVKKVLLNPLIRRGYVSFGFSFPSDMVLG